MYKILTFALFIILIFDSEIFSQSSELVQTGFNSYQNGNYGSALQSFDRALQESVTEVSSPPITESGNQQNTETKEKTYQSESEKRYTETNTKSYAVTSNTELISTQTKKYESMPLEYQGDEPAKIYLYRGRTYLQLGNKQAALNDFDKAVSLDPTLSEVFFRRALANMDIDPDRACPDLLIAIERGHQSAKELYDLICLEQ